MLSELLITHEPFRSPPSWLGFQLGIQLSIHLVFNWYSTEKPTTLQLYRKYLQACESNLINDATHMVQGWKRNPSRQLRKGRERLGRQAKVAPPAFLTP